MNGVPVLLFCRPPLLTGVVLLAVILCCGGCATTEQQGISGGTSAYSITPPAALGGGKLKSWQKPYRVLGKAYTPLLDHNGFVEEGIASWYGKKFNGRKTSNGETYDMYAMTAAHKTLPLGVFVRVENKRTGQVATVRINDRGPFVAGRIIDLSFAAANKLGVVGPGTAPVRITALGYQNISSDGAKHYTLPASIQTGPFTIQVGAFTVRQNAVRLQRQLPALYGRVYVHQARVNDQLFYRVQAGQFNSLAEAELVRERLAQSGYGRGFVVAID